MKRAAFLLWLIVLAAGCSRYIDSENMDFELANDPPVPISLSIVHLTEGVRLSWETADTIANMTFKVYYSDSLGADPILWETTAAFQSEIRGLKPEKDYFFQVSSVVPGGIEGALSSAFSTRVGVLSVAINDNDRYTNSRDVVVRFVVPVSAALVQVSENSAFTDSQWENFLGSRNFTLSAGDGTKTVYARFQFNDGSASDSTHAAADAIILDTEASIDSVYFNPRGTVLAKGSTLTFYLVTPEAEGEAFVSFPGVSRLALPYNATGSNPGSRRYVYSRAYVIPSNLDVIDGVVTGDFIDAAGNEAPSVKAHDLLNISNPPLPVTLVAVAESSSRIRLTWSESSDDDFAAYHLFRDVSSNVTENSQPVTVVSSRSTVTYNDDNLVETTRYFYRIYVYDYTGRSAASNVDSARTLFNQPPNAVTLAVSLKDSAVHLTWTPNEDDDFESYRVYRDPGDTTQASMLEIISSRSQTTSTDDPPSGDYYYRVDVVDGQGKAAPSNRVRINIP
jgi:hypothetical protein